MIQHKGDTDGFDYAGMAGKRKHQQDDEAPWLSRVWLANGISSTMTIPKKLAKAYGLDKACAVVLIEKDEGILIRKLDL